MTFTQTSRRLLLPRISRTMSKIQRLPWLPVFVALIAMLVFFSLVNHNFLTSRNLINIGTDMAEIGVMAIAATIVISAGGIDLSVGGVLALSAIVGAHLLQHGGLDFIITGIVVTLVVAIALGMANGCLSVYASLPPFVVTLATLGITLGLGYQFSNGTGVAGIPASLSSDFGFAEFGGLPAPLLLLIVLALFGIYVMSHTRFGIRNYAIGSNLSAADRAGVDTRRHMVAVYALSGFLAGVAGVIDVSRFSTAAVAAHQTDVLPVITAAVIGGTSLFGGIGTIGGTMVGVAIIGVLTNGLVLMGVHPYMQQVATGGFLLAALLFQQFRRVRKTALPDN